MQGKFVILISLRKILISQRKILISQRIFYFAAKNSNVSVETFFFQRHKFSQHQSSILRDGSACRATQRCMQSTTFTQRCTQSYIEVHVELHRGRCMSKYPPSRPELRPRAQYVDQCTSYLAKYGEMTRSRFCDGSIKFCTSMFRSSYTGRAQRLTILEPLCSGPVTRAEHKG